jgi:hypothetical protein
MAAAMLMVHSAQTDLHATDCVHVCEHCSPQAAETLSTTTLRKHLLSAQLQISHLSYAKDLKIKKTITPPFTRLPAAQASRDLTG